MANAERITSVINELHLPVEEFVVFGGACLALRNIREARDVELFVTKNVIGSLVSGNSWESVFFAGRNHHLLGEVEGVEVQLFDSWDNDIWQPDIERYLMNPDYVAGIPCIPLVDVREWKLKTARPKDLRDVALIDEYLALSS